MAMNNPNIPGVVVPIGDNVEQAGGPLGSLFPNGIPEQFTYRAGWDGRQIPGLNPDYIAYQISQGTPFNRLQGLGQNQYNQQFWNNLYQQHPTLQQYNPSVYSAVMHQTAPGTVPQAPVQGPRVGIDSNRGAWPQPPQPADPIAQSPQPTTWTNQQNNNKLTNRSPIIQQTNNRNSQAGGTQDSFSGSNPYVGRPQGPDAYNPGPPGKYPNLDPTPVPGYNPLQAQTGAAQPWMNQTDGSGVISRYRNKRGGRY